MAAYRKKKKQEEEAEKEDEKKTKEEAEEEQKKKKIHIKQIITNSVDPHELLPGVSHLANPGMCNTTTTTNTVYAVALITGGYTSHVAIFTCSQ